MYKVSDNYRKIIYSGEADHRPLLTINGVEIPYDKISKIIISDPIIDTSSDVFYLGTFISKKITITFRNTEGIELNGDVYLEIGTKVDGEYEYVPIGYFIIDTSTEDFYTKSELVCMDRSILFKPNVDYSTALVDGEITAENLLKWLCEYFKVELGTYPTTNATKTISSYDDTVSGKRYISWLAELMGGNAKFGRDGKLYIIPLKSEPVVEIDALEGESWEVTEKYVIGKVRFDNSTLIKEVGEGEGNTLNLRSENLFLQEPDFEERIENINEAVNGFEVWGLKCENVGDPSLDCWDIISYNLGGVIYNTFYNNTITYEMTIMVKVEVNIPNKQIEKTTNVVGGNIASQVRRVTTIVNQLEGTVTTTSNLVQELNTTIGNNSQDLADKFNGYVPQSEFVSYQESMTEKLDNQSKTFATQEQLIDGSVTMVKTGTTVIDRSGVTVDANDSPTKNLLSPRGMRIGDKNNLDDNGQPNELFFAGYDDNLQHTIVRTNHIKVTTFFEVANNSRIEAYKINGYINGSGMFWIGD